MKVILKQLVPNLGKEGQVVTVRDGYARNYLFPRGLATLADKSQLKVLELRNAKLASKLADTKSTAVALGEKLNGQSVEIEAKVGKDQTRLFGAITSQDIVDALKKKHGVDLEKKQIGLLEPIKRLGHYVVELDLHREVDAKIDVHVFDPAAPVETAPAAATTAPEAPAEVDETFAEPVGVEA